MCQTCHDDASKFVYILSRGKARHLVPEDFVAMIQDVINTHPGLSFLKDAYEFHSRYVQTVTLPFSLIFIKIKHLIQIIIIILSKIVFEGDCKNILLCESVVEWSNNSERTAQVQLFANC
jgi:hypothetical protein